MRYKGLDLNLLGALDVLLELRNVSRAADRLGLSQPAVSAVLGKLRDYFEDDLLVLAGRRMHPTPFAEQLLPSLKQCLAATDVMLLTNRRFDPATAQRNFRIVSSDYAHASLLVDLPGRLADIAPGITLEFILPDRNSTEALARGEIDVLISPPEFTDPRHPTELLYEESFVVAGAKDNPLLRNMLAPETLLAAGQIAVVIGNDRRVSFADRTLAEMLPGRRIAMVASSFTMAAAMLPGTPYLAVLHRRLAENLERVLPIAHAELPFDFPRMPELVQYHTTRGLDAGIRWLIGELHAKATVGPTMP